MTTPAIYSDRCLAFQIENQDIKGRIIRLDKSVHEVLNKHDYPAPVARKLGQAMALSALLGSMMKFEGILTLQFSSNGQIKSLVSDFAGDGNGSGVVRGTCGILEKALKDTPVIGQGQLMITMDQGKYMERYQGIVNLQDNSLTKSMADYFHSSEQLPSALKVSCDRDDQGKWTAAAIMIQHLARSSEDESPDKKQQQDQWTTATILLNSLKDEELLDRELSLQDILFRLYHESGIRIFSATEINSGCRCSDAKLRSVLSGFNTQELQDIAEDGIISMTCEFCKTDHKFELKKLIN